MTCSLEIDHKEMHDIRTAADVTEYSRDHVTSLARAKKIVAAQVGRQWYVDLDSLKQYAALTALEQQVKQKHLSEDRRQARELAKKIDEAKTRSGAGAPAHQQKVTSAVVSMTALFVLVAGSLAIFGDTLLLQTNTQLASTQAVASDGEPVTPVVVMGEKTIPVNTVFSDGVVEVHSLAAAEEAIVLLPQLESVTASVFSDPVEIITASSGVQVLVPKGRPVSEGVPFVKVPVNEISIP